MPSLQTIETRLKLLEDKESVRSLLNRYCMTADDRKWEEFGKCFTEDGVLGFEAWGDVKGPDKIMAIARDAEDRYEGLQHMMTNMEVVVDGDEATCRAYLWFAATKDRSKPNEHYSFGGHYHFNLRRTSEGWRIARMQMQRMWAQNEDTEGVFG